MDALWQGVKMPRFSALDEDLRTGVLTSQHGLIYGQLFTNSAEAVSHLLRPTGPRCPHMGCALTRNKAEHFWDCSCHGSRFDEHEKLLNDPATDDLKHPPRRQCARVGDFLLHPQIFFDRMV